MMARRIVTAREQCELLSPWRTAADETPTSPPSIHDLMPGRFSNGNGRWDYRHQDASDDHHQRHEYGIHPTISPASHSFTNEFDKTYTVHYDPALTGGQVPRPGRFGHEWDDHAALRNEITDLAPPPGMLWRGMSREEYEQSRDRGYFESRGGHNIGDVQKGLTFFSTNPEQAGNYATWFAPAAYKPTFTHPGYVVGIPDRPDVPRGANPSRPDPKSTEVGIPGRVPFGEATHHYVGRPSTIRPGEQGVSEGWRGWEESGGVHPSSTIKWTQLPGPDQHHTAAPRRRFTQDWQHIGGDYVPLDVITHYMDRKGEGFGDEKAPLYEMSGRPPLSQQIKDTGYEKPVELCTDGQSGCVYDGHHRIDVARQLGHTHVPVVVTWRNSSGYPDGAYGNKIEPWLKKWLTDMRGGRETVGKIAARKKEMPWTL